MAFLEKDAIVRLAANLSSAHVSLTCNESSHQEPPETALAQFILASIDDLYSSTCSDSSNFARIAEALINGAAELEFIAREFRKRSEY